LKSATVNRSVTMALLSGMTSLHRQNLFPIAHVGHDVALDLVSVTASQAYVECTFSVRGDMCAGMRKRMNINLEQCIFCE